MNIQFLGAAGEVTGSNYLLQCGDKKLFVDCGIFQGKDDDEKNRTPYAFPLSDIDAVCLTHAHMDHSGRVPYIVSQGFKGTVWATSPTLELLPVLWRDSARLMKEEAEWKTRKNARKGLEPVLPLFTDIDVEAALQKLKPVSYDENVEILPGISARYRDAGHIIGSAILELTLTENDKTVKITFSGDIGPAKTVIERQPATLESSDYVVMESTYGNRLHKDNDETRQEFRSALTDAINSGGKVMIPCFAVDRSQRLLYEICLMQEDGIIKTDVPIFFDSPMGAKATEVYKSYQNLLSSELQSYIAQGKEPFVPQGLVTVETVAESQKINSVKCAIVIAGSGMCNGGRIVHHMKHGLSNPKNHVIFVGYQAQGTLGRRIVDGQKMVRVAGEDVKVEAQLNTINGFSAHGDRNDLLNWAQNFKTDPMFVITHGEPESSASFAELLNDNGKRSFVPARNEVLELAPREQEQTTTVKRVLDERQVKVETQSEKALRYIARIMTLSAMLQDRVEAAEARIENQIKISGGAAPAGDSVDAATLALLESCGTVLEVAKSQITDKLLEHASE